MKDLTGLEGFLPTIEGMIARGELQDAYRLLKNYVSYLRPTPSTVRDVHRYSEGCFWDKEEFLKFVAENRGNLKSLGWVEMPPVKAYYWLAYVACEWNDLNRALEHINEGLAFDPSRPQMICEQAYILSGLHRFPEALHAYHRVASAPEWVADYERARAWRGEGYTLIELNRLDEAERAFKESLKIQPKNENARHELKYIADKRKFLRKHGKKNPLGTNPRVAAARALAEAERIVASENDKNLPTPKGREPRVPRADEPLGRALALYDQALRLWRAAGDLAGQAQTNFGMGTLYALLWDIEKMLEYYQEAHHLWHQAGGHEAEEALVLYKLGGFMFKVSRNDHELLRQALSYLLDSLLLNRKVGNSEGERAALMELARVHEDLGEFHKAIGYYEQLLGMKQSPLDLNTESQVRLFIAKNYERLGEFDFALSFYTPLLSLAENTRNKHLELATLYNIGSIHQVLGNFDDAVRYLKRAHSASNAIGDRSVAGMVLNALGVTYYSRNEKQNALDHYNLSLKLRRELKDRRGELATLNNMSLVYLDLQKWDEARNCLREALKISRVDRDRKGEAHALQILGETSFRGSQPERAREFLEDALKIHTELKDLDGESRALSYLAYTYYELGDSKQARDYIEAAINIIESLRSRVFNPDWRVNVLAQSHYYYEFYVNLLSELEENVAAFEAFERGRARSLLDLLAEAGADIRQGIDPALLTSEQALQEEIILSEQQGLDVSDADASKLFEREKELRAQLQLVQARIRASSPRYATLVQPERPSAEAIQRLLDTDTLLLEFALGHDRSHLWVISNSSLSHHELPSREEIEMLAERFYCLMSGQSLRRDADETSGQPTRHLGTAGYRARMELRDPTLRLSRVLFEKSTAEIRAAKRLLIVGDGALQCIPFAALTAQVGHSLESGEDLRPLVADHEIVSLPSASTLAALRSTMRQRQPAPKSVAIFANPVFRPSERSGQRNHETARLLSPSDPLIANPLTRAAADVGVPQRDGWLNPLPGTEAEAAAIFSLIGQDDGMKALGFDASRDTLEGTDLSQYRIIHFATHGFANNKHPELSGVVLSLFDRMDEPQNGYLKLHDIYNLNLCAELVVLSACKTALGKELRGEGLIGLTRGFMYAGSRRVVASLWSVGDSATAELMKNFYESIQQNQPYAAALREAQLKLMSSPIWGKSPYYWAAFVIQGDWK
jgi:CHAT domain-containing protein/tetratricopeptide (TPR) repeat protein